MGTVLIAVGADVVIVVFAAVAWRQWGNRVRRFVNDRAPSSRLHR
jgi:hypothetical protein